MAQPDPPAPSGSDDSLVDRIKWTTLARVVLLTCVLGFAFAMDIGMGPQPLAHVPETTLYQLTSAFYFVSFFALLATHLARRDARRLKFLAAASVAIDVALALALVIVTDGLHSVFLFGFPLAVLNSALLLYRTGAMVAASLATLGLWAMGALELGWVHWNLAPWRATWLRTMVGQAPMQPYDVLLLLLVQTAAVYGTALLASHLALELDKARRRAQVERRELATLRVRYDDVVSSMPDGILTVDAAGRCSSINPAGVAILGLSEAAVLALRLQDLLPPLSAAADGQEEQEVSRVRTRASEAAAGKAPTQTLACRTVSLRGGPGEGSPGFLVVFRDLTDQRVRDEQHRARERLAAIGAMAAAVAHEIRNPLASISGAVQMLQTSETVAPMDRKLMDIVVRETAQLSAWIGEFLDFARPRPLQLGPCDVRRIALDTLEACAQDPRMTVAGIELRAGPGLQGSDDTIVSADAQLLRQLVWNLLVNAVQAVQQGELRIVELDLRVGMHAVELAVSDSGPGVDDADIPRLFEPFFTTKGEGSGLGLATVMRHATAHHGAVRVERSAWGGARFTVALPRRAASAFSTTRNRPESGLHRAAKTGTLDPAGRTGAAPAVGAGTETGEV